MIVEITSCAPVVALRIPAMAETVILTCMVVMKEAIEEAIVDGLAWLASQQNPDGSWGDDAPTLMELGFALNTFKAWRIASHGLACMALLEAEETPERRAPRAATA